MFFSVYHVPNINHRDITRFILNNGVRNGTISVHNGTKGVALVAPWYVMRNYVRFMRL